MTTQDLHSSLLDSLTFASARTQAEALAAGRVSAVDLLEHALARISHFDNDLNAVVVRNDEGARAAAREADAALARGERKPLLGVPITVKESFDVAGLVTTSGNPDYANNVAAQDSLAVAALRAAGAVIVGKSNVPLALADLQSYNLIYGVSNNPWDTTRTPGGSSGGSAAALAAGYVALELGTDIGGSIRIPAHFNGVYGHKPTAGLVAMRGTGVPSGRLADRDLSVAGPLARTASDLELALDLLVNLEPLAAKAWKATLPPARHVQLKDFRVLVIDEWPGSARSLLGSSLASPPALSKAAQKRLEALAADDDSADAAWLRAPTLRHSDWLRDNERRVALRHQWERLFETFDVVATPVAPLPAFRHNHNEPKDARTYPVEFEGGAREVRFLDLFHWAGLPVLPGLPATSFPVGLDDDGLPVSAQAVGPYLEDRTTIAFAHLLEQVYGGFIAPPGFGAVPATKASRP